MAHLTDTFALCARPSGFHAWDPVSGSSFILTPRGKKFWVYAQGTSLGKRPGADEVAFSTEEAAWGYAQSQCPGFVPHLLTQPSLALRAVCMRAQLFLSQGEATVQGKIRAIEEEIFLIHRHALAALSALKADDTPLKIERRRSDFIGWMRLEHLILGPVTKAPVSLGVCVLPSPVQDKTWTVQFELVTHNDEMLEWLQLGHDRMVDSLACEGIRVKDVLSGIRTI